MQLAEYNGPTMLARIGMMRALHRHRPKAAHAPRRKRAKASGTYPVAPGEMAERHHRSRPTFATKSANNRQGPRSPASANGLRENGNKFAGTLTVPARPVEPSVRLRDVWLVQSVERYAQTPWLAPNNVAVLAEMTISHQQCNLVRN